MPITMANMAPANRGSGYQHALAIRPASSAFAVFAERDDHDQTTEADKVALVVTTRSTHRRRRLLGFNACVFIRNNKPAVYHHAIVT